MTPEQLDHLRRIDAHLVNLLSTAEKRTSGEWTASRIFGDWGFASIDQIITRTHRPENDGHGITLNYGGVIQCVGPKDKRNEQSKADAAFIAACAGNAEAGWRATRAAIATALDCESWDAMIKEMYIRQDAEAILESILAAFPNV